MFVFRLENGKGPLSNKVKRGQDWNFTVVNNTLALDFLLRGSKHRPGSQKALVLECQPRVEGACREQKYSWLVGFASSWTMATDLFGSFHGWWAILGYLFWQEARCYFHLPWSIWGDKCLPHPDKWPLWFAARETELWLLYFISEKTSAIRSVQSGLPCDQDSKVFLCLKDTGLHSSSLGGLEGRG